MRVEKIRELDEHELTTQHKDMQEQLFRLRFQMRMGQTDGVKKYRQVKKDRARVLTVQREREIAKARPAGDPVGAPPEMDWQKG